MPVWAWILIAVAAVVIVAIAGWLAWEKRRTGQLKSRFGPEYDRTVSESGGRRKAESELDSRRKRRQQLDIRPLSAASRQRYLERWRSTQARFVDAPGDAIRDADALVIAVMTERGYPMDDFEQQSADVSVDHPHVVENYRAAHGISLANDHGKASTEDLRQGMVDYRALFEELLEERDEETETRREAR
jgi:ABC-type nickel/cobalt efflux system permease component RcnA